MYLQYALQVEQTKFEEKKKLEEQDFSRLKKEKVHSEIEISALKQDLEIVKRTHEEHVSELELRATESKAEYEKRIEELKLYGCQFLSCAIPYNLTLFRN